MVHKVGHFRRCCLFLFLVLVNYFSAVSAARSAISSLPYSCGSFCLDGSSICTRLTKHTTSKCYTAWVVQIEQRLAKFDEVEQFGLTDNLEMLFQIEVFEIAEGMLR